VVVATGWCDEPAVPTIAERLDRRITQLTPRIYSSPHDVPDGGVLVVGASASGVQLADELAAAGRRVVLSVGSHTRVPRTYRGMDICWWLDAMGTFARPTEALADPTGALYEPSLQLAGRPDRRDVDLATLQGKGVGLLGRVTDVSPRRITLRDDLPATTAASEARLRSVLARIDAFAERAGLAGELQAPQPHRPVGTDGHVGSLDLVHAGIRTVIWATGYRRFYPWLKVPVLDGRGEIQHARGKTAATGLYVVGMRWQSRRDSSFIDGVRHDAELVTRDILELLGARKLAGTAA
jgi:putative flavoprotein involved in K+ transport